MDTLNSPSRMIVSCKSKCSPAFEPNPQVFVPAGANFLTVNDCISRVRRDGLSGGIMKLSAIAALVASAFLCAHSATAQVQNASVTGGKVIGVVKDGIA